MGKRPAGNVENPSGISPDKIQALRLLKSKRDAELADLNLPKDTSGSFAGAGFKGGSDYDQNLIEGTNQERARAVQQGGLDEFGNMLGRIGLNIVPGLIGSVAGMADVEDYMAGITEQDEVGNAVTRWADEWKKRTNQDLFPIYKQNPDKPLDIGSTEWWADNGGGLLESAAEFAILGFGVGGLLTKGMQATNWLRSLTTVTDAVTGIQRLNKGAELTALGTNAFLLNHAEGMLEATQIYGSELEKNMKLVEQGKLTEEQAKINAGAAAGHTLNINRANILLNLTGVSSIMKGARGSRNLVRSLSTPQKLILEGGQEYLEESVNFYASNRGEEYGKALREGKEYTGATAQKFVDDVLSARGFEAGFLGALGGVAQTGAIAAGTAIRGGKDVEKAYEAEQKAVRTGYEDLRNENKLKSVRDLGVAATTLTILGQQRAALEADIQKAKEEGKPVDNNQIAAWQNINDQIQDEQLHASFQSGTAEYTEKAYQDIEKLTEEEALKNGFTGSELDPKSPAYYKHTARRMQERLTALEKQYNKTAGYNNSFELYKNRATALRVNEQLNFFTNKESELAANAQEAVDRLNRTEKLLARTEGNKKAAYLGDIELARLEEADYEKLANSTDEDIITYRKELIATAKNLPEVQALEKTRNAKLNAQKELDSLNTTYSQQTTSAYQNKLRQEVEAKQAEQKAEIEADKIRAAAVKQQSNNIAAKVQAEHAKNAAAFDATLKQQGITDEERAGLKAVINKEINTPVGQAITYTTEEEMLMAKYPAVLTEYRNVLHAAVATDTNLGKPNERVFTDSDNAAADEVLLNLEKTGLDAAATTLVSKTAPVVNQPNKLDRANNVMAWLSRVYDVVINPETWSKGFADVDNKLNDELKDPSILDARTLKIGDDVVLKIDLNGVVPVKDAAGNDITIPWADFETQNAGKPATLAANAPIGIYRKNNDTTPIGYVHLPSWINSSRVKGDAAQIAEEIEKVIHIRNFVHAAGPAGVTTKITQRTLGKLFLDANKQAAPVSVNLKDPDLDYVVFYKNRLLASETSTRDTDKDVLNRDKLRSGVTYVLLPVEKNVKPNLTKYWAVPLKVEKLSANVIDSVARASEVFLHALDKKLTPEDIAIAEAIVEMQKNVKAADGSAINFDITTEEGIINYTELFIYNHTAQNTAVEVDPETGETRKAKDLDFDKYFLQKYKSLPSDYFAHKFNRKNGLQFGSGTRGVAPRVDDTQFMQAWKEHLANRYQHTSLRFLHDKNVKLPIINPDNSVAELAPGNSYLSYLKQNAWTTNVIGQNIAEGTQPDNWVYTIQQIIEFDTSAMGVENAVTTEEEREEAAKARAKAIKEAKKLEKQKAAAAPGGALTPEDIAFEKSLGEDLRFQTLSSGDVRLFQEAPVLGIIHSPAGKFGIKGQGIKNIIWFDTLDDAVNHIVAPAAASVTTTPVAGPVKHTDIDKQNMATLDSLFSEDALPGLENVKTAVTGEVVVTENQTKQNIQEESATEKLLQQDLLKSETAYQGINSKYTLPKSEHFDNASLRDLLEYWTNAIVNAYQNDTANAALSNKQEKLFIENYFKTLKTNLEKRLTISPEGSKNHNIASYSLANWEIMQNLIKHNLQRDFSFNFKTYTYEQKDPDENNKLKSLEDTERDSDDASNPDESRSVKERWTMDSLEQDPAKGLSSRFRRFLGGIKDTSRHYLVQKDQHPNFKPVRLYRTLSALLADRDPDFNQMMDVLDQMSDKVGFEYLAIVRRSLMAADEQIQAEFVSTMSKHYVNMKHLYVVSRQSGFADKIYEGYVRDDNYNAKVEVIKDRWEHDLYLSAIAADYAGADLKEGRAIYKKAEIDELVEIFEKQLLVDGNRPHGKETADVDVKDFDIENWLSWMGISLSPGVVADLKKHGIREDPNPKKNKHKYRNMFYADDGEFWRIYKFLKNIQDIKGDVFIENMPLTRESSIHRLASFDAKYNLDALSNSHKSGNKSIFSYADNKYLFDRARQLGGVAGADTADLELMEKLVASPFAGKYSQELRQMLVWDTATNNFARNDQGQLIYDAESDFNKNFKVAYTSLSMLIEKGIPTGNKNSLEDLDAREHMITKFMLFQNRATKTEKGARRGQLFHMTLSDKNTMVLFEKPIPGIGLNAQGQIDDATVDMLYNNAVMPEINRMLVFDETYPPNIKGYAKGQRLFYIFPQLNLIDDLFNIQLDPSGKEVARSLKKDVTTNPAYKALINNAIRSTITTEVAYTLQNWEDLGMLHKDKNNVITSLEYLDGHYNAWVKKQIGNKEDITPAGAVVNYAATEMAVAYMLHDTNLFQLFTTDPATQYKYKKPDPDAPVDVMDEVYQTYENISKRLGGEISPGRDGNTQYTGGHYNLAVMSDIEIPSKALAAYQKLFKDDPEAAAQYAKLTSTDGAEFITLPEKLRFMREHAKLTPEQLDELDVIEKKYKKSITAIKAGKDPSEHYLDYNQLQLIFQVDKPIMVGTRYDKNVEAKLFVKSAAFTLIPELVKGTELEQLMAFMSNPDNPIDRMAMSSAVKLGAPVKALELFDAKGNFNQKAVLDPSDVIVVPRKYLRLQQETPYKENTEITRVSQVSKQAFVNILDVKGFRLPGVEKPYTGQELNKKYNQHFEYLYKSSYDELVKKLGITTDENGKVSLDYKKLNDVIQDELVARGYPAHDLDALEITRFPKEETDKNGNVIPLPEGVEPQWRFKMPIWAAAQSGKLESFLNSIISNKILKQKFNGYGFVLGPEGGYKFRESEEATDATGKKLKKGVLTDVKQLSKKLQGQIVFTDKFDPATGLKPALLNNGWNQVILPWKYKEDLKKYMVNGKLNPLMFDKELLKVFGMRIPNQGPNSTAAIEVVGFFPPSAGDLLVAPADFTKQMGSDFDIDKLYTYMYHSRVQNDGRLQRYDIPENATNEKSDRDEHQNKLLDIYLAINTNPDPKVQELINRPLTTEDLGDIAADFDAAKKARSLDEAKTGGKISPYDLSPASGNYQSFKYQASVVAGTAIGAFAVQNTFNALAQTVEGGLKMVSAWSLKPGEAHKYTKIKFGRDGDEDQEVFDGNLSQPKTKSGKYKSTNIAAMLSAALDNGNEPILGRLGVNMQNISVVNFLLQAGFELRTISNFINQDILQEYTKQLAIANGNHKKAFAIVTSQKQFAFEDEVFKNAGKEPASKENKAVPKGLPFTGTAVKEGSNPEWDEEAYTHSADTRNPVAERFWNFYNMGAEELFSYIALGEKASGYKEAQFALLRKFQSMSRKHASNLRQLQGLSNIDSKGIGANMFQSLLQQEDIESLGKERALDIENASKLFGDFKPAVAYENDPVGAKDLLDQGYVKGKDYYFKPSSIPGFAYAYGVITNNKIWQDHFPYAKFEVYDAIGQVSAKMRGGASTIFSKAEQYKKIFRELKGFVFTDNVVSPIDPAEARKLLLHDYSEQSEEGDKINHASLATIMFEVKNNPATQKLFRESMFLNSLYVKATPDKRMPKVIMFRQVADDETSNRDIYNEVYNLIKYPVDFGVFNGIKYTSRTFIEHLMLAANVSMTSAMQLNLMQYMPTELLVQAGYAEKLHQYDWTRLHQNGVDEPFRSTVQYFQHQPGLTPEIDLNQDIEDEFTIYGHSEITEEEIKQGITPEDAQAAAATKPENIKQFTLKADTADEELATFYHLKVGKKILLFQLTDKDLKQYSRISTLLNSATSNSHEYNANVAHATSIISENNPHALTVPAAFIGRQNLPAKNRSAGYNQAYNKDRANNIDNILAGYGVKKATYNLTTAQTDNMLEQIFSNSALPAYKLTAKWLQNMLTLPRHPFHVNVRFENLPDNKKGMARVSPKTGHIQIWINPYMVDSDNGKSDFEHTVLHELVHAVTKLAILQGEHLEGQHPEGVAGKLMPSQRRAYKNLNKLFKEYEAKYIHNATAQALLAKIKADPKSLTLEESQEALDYIYPGKNLAEFLSGIMLRPNLRQRLQNMQYSTDVASPKTFWERILDIFELLMGAMGLKQGSTSANAVKDIIFLAEEGNVNFANSDTLKIPIETYTEPVIPVVKTNLTGSITTEVNPELDVQSAEQIQSPAELEARQELYDKTTADRLQKIEEHLKENPPPQIGFGGAQLMSDDIANLLDNDALFESLPNISGSIAAAPEAGSTIKKPRQRTKKTGKTSKVTLKISRLLADREFTIRQLSKHEASLRADLRDSEKTKTKEDIKNLRKRIAKVKENREAAEAEWDKIAKLTKTESIVAVGEADMKAIADQLLHPGDLDMRDFHILRTRLNLWLNYDENFLDKADQKSLISQSLFKDVIAAAKTNDRKLLALQQNRIYNWSKDYLKRDISEEAFYSAMKDIGPLASFTLGLDNSNHPLTQAVAQAVQISEAEQVEEFFGIQQEIKTLFAKTANKENLTGKNYKNFFEVDDDGIFTGKLVRAYSAAFVAQKDALRSAVTTATNRKARSNARRALDKFRQENELFFDLRKLVKLPGFEEMHAEDAGKLEAELKKTMGEIKYNETLKEAEEAYQRYLMDAENQQEYYEAKYPEDPEHVKNAMKKWHSNNNVVDYWEYMTNPKNKKITSAISVYSWRYAFSIPKATNAAGQSQYSEQYLKLQQDADVAALHKYILDLLKKLRSYIPADQQREFAANSVPTVEKELVETLKTEGLVAAAVSLADKLKMGLTSKEQGEYLYGVNVNNRSLDIRVKSLANDIEVLYAQKVRDYEREFNTSLDVTKPADQQKLLQFKKAASEEVQKESSLDLPHLLALFSQALTIYRHKAKIEDPIRLAEETFISSVKENLENSAGEPIERQMPEGQSQPEHQKLSQENHIRMLNNYVNHFFGVKKPVELQTKTKLYTKKENVRVEDLRAELTKHQADLTSYEAELENLKSTTEGLSAEQAEERSKQVTEIDAKRARTAAAVEEITTQIAALGQYITGTGATNTLIQALIVKGLGWNVFGGLTNVFVGTMSNFVEASGGRWYNEKEMRQAMGIALNGTVRALSGSLYANQTTRKINQLMTRWDILKSVTKEQFRNETPTDNFLGNAHWGQVYKTTEYLNQSTVLVAMMLHTKIKDLEGKDSNLWEAFGETGEWDSKRFGDINAQDSPFKSKDRAFFKAKVDKVIRNNHGNYAKSFEIALKQKSLGKLLAVFRGWMFEGFRVRFEGESEEFVDDFKRKGRYLSYQGSSMGLGAAALGTAILPGIGTAAGFLLGSYLGNKFRDDSRFKEGFKNTSAFEELAWTTKYLIKKLSFGAIYGGVTLDERFNEVDAINLRRNMAEISFMLYVTGAMMALAYMLKGDEDDEDKRVLMYSLNVMHRLQQDLGFYSNPVTTMTILQDPMPALGLVSDSMNFIKHSAGLIVDPASDEIPTGIYAGDSKWFRSFQKMFPGTKAWQSFWNMTEQEIKDQ